jgi:thiamine biosynthesis lipoprotein
MTAGVTTALLAPDRLSLSAWGSTATLTVTDPAGLPGAARMLRAGLAEFDAACSRFRPDSEISRLHARGGEPVRVGPVLAEALSTALRAAELTDGLVDPTVGRAMRAIGYDRDFAEIAPDAPQPLPRARPAPGWWQLDWDPGRRLLRLPVGIELDLGATAKALAADRIAVAAAAATGCGVLVSLGGDVRAAGPAPTGGWVLGIGDDHLLALDEPHSTVTIAAGGLAGSGTVRRSWRRAGRPVHHIVDPRTGTSAAVHWRTATVAAASCVDANIASTAAIVLGDAAAGWLRRHRLPARLVTATGSVRTVAGWAGR